MSTASHSVLLYEDRSVTPRIVRWVNCSASPPKPISGTNVTNTHHAIIWDMCCVPHGDKQLLIMTRANNGLLACNTQRAHLGWTVKGKLTGMERDMSVWGATTDGHGHLFVCDINNSCVQMFSAGGRYMGALLKGGDQGLAQPWLIRWCEKTSSLVVVHIMQRKYQISVIRVTTDDTAGVSETTEQEVGQPSASAPVSESRPEEVTQVAVEANAGPATSSTSAAIEQPTVHGEPLVVIEETEQPRASKRRTGDPEVSEYLKAKGNILNCRLNNTYNLCNLRGRKASFLYCVKISF